MRSVSADEQHRRTTRAGIHAVVRTLNDYLGPTVVAALAGVGDPKLPHKWAKDDGPVPREASSRRLMFAHRQLMILVSSDGGDVARMWFVGGNPRLGESTPITAIREDRYDEVVSAVRSFLESGR